MPRVIENNDATAHLSWGDQLAKLLRAVRLHREMTVKQLSKEIDKSPRHIHRIEAAQCTPSGQLVDRWLMACGAELHVELWSKW